MNLKAGYTGYGERRTPQKYFAQVFQAMRIEVNDELGRVKRVIASKYHPC